MEEGKERNDKEAKSESHKHFQGRNFGYKSEMTSSHAKSLIKAKANQQGYGLVEIPRLNHQESVAARRDNTWSEEFSGKPA